jgi:hypothetical protein
MHQVAHRPSYADWLPNHLLIIHVCLLFAVLNPLVLPFGLIYFAVETGAYYVSYRWNIFTSTISLAVVKNQVSFHTGSLSLGVQHSLFSASSCICKELRMQRTYLVDTHGSLLFGRYVSYEHRIL